MVKIIPATWAMFVILGATALFSQVLPPPYIADFEVGEGFQAGSLNGQQGWEVLLGEAAVSSLRSYAGTSSIELPSGQTVSRIWRPFGEDTGGRIIYLDFYAKAAAGDSINQTVTIDAGAARFGFFRHELSGWTFFYDGGASGGQWHPSPALLPVDGDGRFTQWQHFTLRQDYSTKKWDLYIAGVMVAQGVGFADQNANSFLSFVFTSKLYMSSNLDQIYLGYENPLFVDQDHDGMEDTWEVSHGMSPLLDDREIDADGDSLSNIEEYVLQTKPNDPDSDTDGIPDGWEILHGLNPLLLSDGHEDIDLDGLSNIAEYQQNRNPWPDATVAGGLRVWYRADLGVTKDAQGKVSRWVDVSGNGLNLEQGNTDQQPVLITGAAGKPAVSFGGTQILKSAGMSDVQQGTSDFTVFILLKPAASQHAQNAIIFDANPWGTGNLQMYQSPGTTNQVRARWPAGGWGVFQGPTIGVGGGSAQLVGVIKNGSSVKTFVNGTLKDSEWAPGEAMNAQAAPFAVGGGLQGGTCYQGEVAEILIYNRVLTEAERLQIEAAMTTKYGLDDTDSDGLPDSWEKTNFGVLDYGPTDDPGSTGRTILASYQQNRSPWPDATVAGGLRVWYRADLGVTKDAQGKVSRWVNVSGNGLNLEQGYTDQQPVLITGAGGKPAVSFGGTQILKSADTLDVQQGTSDFTAFILLKPAVSQHPENAIIFDANPWGTGNLQMYQSPGTTNQVRARWPAGGWGVFQGPTIGVGGGSAQLVGVVKNGSSVKTFVNGALKDNEWAPGEAMNAQAAPFAVGGGLQSGTCYQGEVAEILIYNRVLTEAERLQIEAAMTTKYGLDDTDSDGLPDSWEKTNFGVLDYGPTDDPGSTGRTILASYQQNRSPWPDATVAGGLRVWYRADLGVTKDAQGKVSRWVNVSGNGLNLEQGYTDQQPVLITGAGGKPAVSFGGTQILKSADTLDVQQGTSDFTAFILLKPAVSQHPENAIIFDANPWGTGNLQMYQSPGTTNQVRARWPAGGWGVFQGPTIGVGGGSAQLVGVVKNGSSVKTFLNGTLKDSEWAPGEAMNAQAALFAVGGGLQGGTCYQGEVAEILIYNRVLTEAERLQIETELTTKYLGGNIDPAGDSDNDGMVNGWEVLHGLNMYVDDANGDLDLDGVTNLNEYRLGRNPTKTSVSDVNGSVDLKVFVPR